MSGSHKITEPVAQGLSQELFERKLQKAVDAACQTVDGQRVRGYTTRTGCWQCGKSRWDDGTPCKGCGAYMKDNPATTKEEEGLG